MKKILFITYFSANEPLLDSRTTPLLREFSKLGIEYHLVTFEKMVRPGQGMLFYDVKYLKNQFDRIGVKWHPLAYHKRPPVISTVYDVIVGVFRCVFIALREKTDFIHAQTAVGGAIAFFVSRILHKKYVYDINGLLAEEYADGALWDRKSMVFKTVRNFEKKIILRADGIIPLSERFARNLKEGRYVANKKQSWNLQVISSHVDTSKFKPADLKDAVLLEKYNLKDKFVLIYAGSIGTWYMFGEMLDFFKIMSEIIPDSVFLVVSHADKAVIKNEVYSKKANNVIIAEALPDDMPRYFSVADAGIFFIKPVFSKEACSPIKLGEYLASGLPVVINSNVGDTEDIVKRANIGVVIGGFEHDLYKKAAAELKRLIDNDRELKNRCRKAAEEQLSFKVAFEKYKCLYNDTFGIL